MFTNVSLKFYQFSFEYEPIPNTFYSFLFDFLMANGLLRVLRYFNIKRFYIVPQLTVLVYHTRYAYK